MRVRGIRGSRDRDGKDSDEDYFGSGIPSHGLSVTQPVVVLVASRNTATLRALEYAKSLSPDIRAVHIATSEPAMVSLRAEWEVWAGEMPLVILPATSRFLTRPVIQFLDAIQGTAEAVTVILAQRIRPWWHWYGISKSFLIRFALKSRHEVIVITVRCAEPPA